MDELLNLRVGQKLMAKVNINCIVGGQINKGEIVEVIDFRIEKTFENIQEANMILKIGKNHYNAAVDIEYFDIWFCNISNDPVEFDYTLEQLQTAYNNVVQSENEYTPYQPFTAPIKQYSQDDKQIYHKDLELLMSEIEAFNEASFKESAINVALENRDEKTFMQLTGGN